MPDSSASDIVPSARALLKQRDYLFFWGARWFGAFAAQIESVALGWQMYGLARRTMDVQQSAFMVGMIGLAAFLPVLLLTLPAGETADRHDRRKVALACLAGEMASALLLTVAAWRGFATPALLLVVATLFGAFRAFFSPANTAMGPMLVPRQLLPRSIAWNSLAWQTAAIAGPAAGGLLVAISPAHAFVAAVVFYAVAAFCVTMIGANTRPVRQSGSRWASMKEGLAYVWREKFVLGAISLDLFAVLLGGATALLPIFAKDVLHTGPWGLGLLRAAPAVGALLMSLWLARHNLERRVGTLMFASVAGFGVATLVFAVSTWLWVSLVALFALGAFDMVSMVIRGALVQLDTPDDMRGRVSAVNAIFINTSNQLGEFESGLLAAWLGAVNATLIGGIGTLVVVGLWMWMFPTLRQRQKLHAEPNELSEPAADTL